MFEPTTDVPPAGLSTTQLEDGAVVMAAQAAAAQCRALVWLAAFEAEAGWGGSTMTATFCSYRLGDTPAAAREKVAVARALGSLPRITEAFAAGQISFSAVRTLVRVATPEIEDQLVCLAREATGSMLARIVKRYRGLLAEHAGGEPGPGRHAARRLSYSFDEEGFFHLTGTFGPEAGAVIEAALDRAAAEVKAAEDSLEPKDRPSSGTERPWEARQADALVALCESYTAHGAACRPGAARTEVIVHVDAALLSGGPGAECPGVEATGAECPGVEATGAGAGTGAGEAGAECPRADGTGAGAGTGSGASGGLAGGHPRCELEAGDTPIGPEAARRVSCDASVVAVIEDAAGVPLSVGRRSRSIPTPIRRALESRDRGCVFPGCGERRFVEGHHIVHWARGGETALWNLSSLCFGHHRLVHEGGYRLEATPPGAGAGTGFCFFRPDGSQVGPPEARPAEAPRNYPVVAQDALCQYAGGGLNLGDALLRLYGEDGRFAAVARGPVEDALRATGPEEPPVENAWMYEEDDEGWEPGPTHYDWEDPPPPG